MMWISPTPPTQMVGAAWPLAFRMRRPGWQVPWWGEMALPDAACKHERSSAELCMLPALLGPLSQAESVHAGWG